MFNGHEFTGRWKEELRCVTEAEKIEHHQGFLIKNEFQLCSETVTERNSQLW